MHAEDPGVVRRYRQQAGERQEASNPRRWPGREAYRRGADHDQENELVRTDETQRSPEEIRDHGAADAPRLREGPQRPPEKRRAGDEVRVRQGFEDREHACQEVQAAVEGAVEQLESEPAHAGGREDEQESRGTVARRQAGAVEPSRDSAHERQQSCGSEGPIGESRPRPEQGRESADERPLEVDEPRGVVVEDELVDEDERAMLSLLDVREVVVGVVHVVEEADEGTALRGGELREQVRDVGESGEQEPHEQNGPQELPHWCGAPRGAGRHLRAAGRRAPATRSKRHRKDARRPSR
jgi:hypothetical protein